MMPSRAAATTAAAARTASCARSQRDRRNRGETFAARGQFFDASQVRSGSTGQGAAEKCTARRTVAARFSSAAQTPGHFFDQGRRARIADSCQNLPCLPHRVEPARPNRPATPSTRWPRNCFCSDTPRTHGLTWHDDRESFTALRAIRPGCPSARTTGLGSQRCVVARAHAGRSACPVDRTPRQRCLRA